MPPTWSLQNEVINSNHFVALSYLVSKTWLRSPFESDLDRLNNTHASIDRYK